MAKGRSEVSIKVDKSFFKSVFEPSRKQIESQLGVKVSQAKFTRMLKDSGFSMKLKLGGKNARSKK